jgi:glyceraldehyde 3-phosphate dehydrogenase
LLTGRNSLYTAEKNPAAIPWGIIPDIVVEATGIFRAKESAKGGYGDHLKAGAKKVILTVPSKDAIDATIVLGVNDQRSENLNISAYQMPHVPQTASLP